jgi:hypothetical protein
MQDQRELLRSAIFETIENQLKNNDPPEAKETLVRLMAEGYSEQDAKDLIGCIISREIFEILKHHKPFDLGRYLTGLRRLPTLPWD